jgi:hypothetical protein
VSFALDLGEMRIGCDPDASNASPGRLVSGSWPARFASSLGAMAVERPLIPTGGRLPAWRLAYLVYREMRQNSTLLAASRMRNTSARLPTVRCGDEHDVRDAHHRRCFVGQRIGAGRGAGRGFGLPG